MKAAHPTGLARKAGVRNTLVISGYIIFFIFCLNGSSAGIITGGGKIDLWVKVAYSLMVLMVVPVYLVKYKITNLLWFSDITLIGTAVALWLEHSLIASMLAAGTIVAEIGWNFGFFFTLITGKKAVGGLAGYMFNKTIPLYLRLLSLFHIPMPLVTLWLVSQLCYDDRAFIYQVIFTWIVLVLTWIISDPEDNINWVFSFGDKPITKNALLHLIILMILFPLLLILPGHLLLGYLFC